MGVQGYVQTQGTIEATNATPDASVIASPGSGKVLRITKAVISVTVAAVGGGGEVALEDGVGGTRFFEADADAVGLYSIDFGDLGYALTGNTLLNLTVDGAATTQATVRATVVSNVMG